MWNRAHNVSKPRLIDVDRPASEAVPNDPDSDFDDPAPLPPKKRAKKASKPTKHVPKAVPRINACGVKNLDRTLLEIRDNYPNSQVALCLLSESLLDTDAVRRCAPVSLFVAKTRDGTSYKLTADEDDLDENEFMGLFASGPYDRADPGVCDAIITWLKADERYTVLVVDPSERGMNFARLAASVAATKWAFETKARTAVLTKPAGAKWQAALKRCGRGRSWAEVRELARDWFVSL